MTKYSNTAKKPDQYLKGLREHWKRRRTDKREQIADEVKRADAVVAVADQIVRNADLQIKAVTILANHGARVSQHLTMLEDTRPPALAAVPSSTWCDQCEAKVGPEEAARCQSAHCKAKAAAA